MANSRFFLVAFAILSLEANATIALVQSPSPQSETRDYGPSFSSMITKVNIFNSQERDPRIIQITDGKVGRAFAPIGRVETIQKVPQKDKKTGVVSMKRAGGTSFLVSPCLVLTNYHAVFGESTTPTESFGSTFFANENDGKSHKQIKATPVLWGHLDSDASNKSEDFVLLQLDVCEGKKIGWLEIVLRKTKDLINIPVASAGYPGDKNIDDLWIDPNCMQLNYNLPGLIGTFANSCALVSGSSGSPVFDLKNGYPQVLSMQTLDLTPTDTIITSYDPDHANIAIDVRKIYPRIEDKILADKAAFPFKNPALLP